MKEVLEHVMERVGKITAADNQLEVLVRGVDAYAMPGQVVIPSIETYSWLGENAERMLHGLLDHEVAHARDTDFTVVEQLVKVEKNIPLKILLNAVEDARIEAKHGRRFYGVSQNLRRKNEWFVESEEFQNGIRKGHPWMAFCCALTMIGRHAARISFFEALNPLVHEMLVAVDARKLIDGMDALPSTQAALDRSRKIIELFEDPSCGAGTPDPDEGDIGGGEPKNDDDASDEEKRSAEGNPEPGGGEEDGEDADAEGDDEEGDTEASGAAGDDPGGAEKDEEKDEGGGSELGSGALPKVPLVALDLTADDEHKPGEPLNPEQAILGIIRAVFEDDNHQPYTVFSHEYDVERDFSADAEDLKRLTAQWDELVLEAESASDALASAFEVGLAARREKRPIGGNDEGEIDPGMLVEYSLGSAQPDTLYQQWVAEDERLTAAAVLCDCSGSMGLSVDGSWGRGVTKKSELCRITAIALHRALLRVFIPHEVSGFTTINEHSMHVHPWVQHNPLAPGYINHQRNFASMRQALVEAAEHGTEVERFAREYYEGGDPRAGERVSWAHRADLLVPFHAVFKSFSNDDGRGLCHIAGVHENLDGEAVLWQARRLAQRPEHRRVMFVLSDGMPLGSRNAAQGARYLQESVRRVIDAGIEIYGIGMADDSVSEFYPTYWVVNDLGQLVEVSLSALIGVLLEHRQEKQWVHI